MMKKMALHPALSGVYICTPMENTPSSHIALFRGKEIRKVIYQNEWWFSIVDIVGALTDNERARKYWNDLKNKLMEQGYTEVSDNIGQLKLPASDGKSYLTDCANTETVFRIIQSIPSPKAEPFKRWLAKVGYERVQEIEDPELATKRTRALYKAKGYSDGWIEKRMRGIAIREELTDEWKNRGAENYRDYEILTAEISKATLPEAHARTWKRNWDDQWYRKRISSGDRRINNYRGEDSELTTSASTQKTPASC